jgi:phospholipid/cholesterol/gamma-HCH transport system permease protein
MGTNNRASQSPASLALDGQVARCSGDWTVRGLHPLERQLPRMRWPPGRLAFDLAGVHRMDTGGAWLLWRLTQQLRHAGHEVALQALTEDAAELLAQVQATGFTPGAVPRPRRPGWLRWLRTLPVDDVLSFLGFVGRTGQVLLQQLLRPQRIRWRQISDSLADAGYRALGIVGLLSFLLGVVIAYQGGVQLEQYGASLFIADLVGLSMVRELAPLITAIIVAGRTGSAYTAQIGTMQVTEEVDALRSLGIDPLELLVLPKLLALVIAVPLLTVYADIMGILGGMLMANVQLDLAIGTFTERVGEALTLNSYLIGVGKAPVFAAIIAVIGCYQGFRVQGSAESVGRRTTVSVVQSIFAVIVVDAAFSVAFSYLGM